MKSVLISLAVAAAALAAPAYAQDPANAPLRVSRQAEQPTTVLPANTEVMVAPIETITTKGERWHEGDTFPLRVVQDVLYGETIVIPKGSRAVGRITRLTDKGMFGKSGKIDIEIEYVEVSGRRIPMVGSFKQEGEGNTVAAVGAVVALPVAGLFITGKSGVIPEGRELLAYTEADVPLAIE